MSTESLIEQIVDEFKKDPRNKVFADWALLIESAAEETGKAVKSDALKKVIGRYISGDMKGNDETLYDGAVAACGTLARHCFGDDPDADVDYEIDWIENDDGTYTAEVRPT